MDENDNEKIDEACELSWPMKKPYANEKTHSETYSIQYLRDQILEEKIDSIC